MLEQCAVDVSKGYFERNKMLRVKICEIIRTLRAKKEQIDRVIALFEEYESSGDSQATIRRERGRKSMAISERRLVSERMRQY